MTNRVKIVKDDTQKIMKALKSLMSTRVLVGIPEAKANRKEGPMNNAALGYIHEFGSPLANIPARPFLTPGIKKSEKAWSAEFRKAIVAKLDGDSKEADHAFEAAGQIAETSAKVEIATANFVPLKPETIANRWRQRRGTRGVKSRREGEQVYLDLVRQGVDPSAAQGEVGIQPLINTGSLRDSLTHVVIKKGSK